MKKHTILAIPLAVLALAAPPAFADKDKPPHAQSQPGHSPKADGRHDNGKHKGWYKNGKAGEKSAKKAERRAQKNGAVVVATPNGTVIDRTPAFSTN